MNQHLQPVAMLLLGVVMFGVVFVVMLTRPMRQEKIAATEPIVYRIDINQADRDTLSLLPGIAQGKAQRIVDDRRVHGTFANTQDLTRVSLIGDKTAAAIEPWVRFDAGR